MNATTCCGPLEVGQRCWECCLDQSSWGSVARLIAQAQASGTQARAHIQHVRSMMDAHHAAIDAATTSPVCTLRMSAACCYAPVVHGCWKLTPRAPARCRSGGSWPAHDGVQQLSGVHAQPPACHCHMYAIQHSGHRCSAHKHTPRQAHNAHTTRPYSGTVHRAQVSMGHSRCQRGCRSARCWRSCRRRTPPAESKGRHVSKTSTNGPR
jgi:hypothetical protein